MTTSHSSNLLRRFSGWQEFKAEVTTLLFSDGRPGRGKFLFRGQRNAAWSLAPSFDRSFPGIKGKRRESLEISLLEEFRRQCEVDVSLRETVKDQTALMAMGQHHGLPTRLLDWTESPYIAAFFAYQHALHVFGTAIDTVSKDAVAVWVLDATHYIWSERYGVQILSPGAWDNARLFHQAGRFTLSRTPHQSLQQYAASFDDAADALRLIELPLADAATALADLDLMGINSASMFPGVDGRARAAITRIVLGIMAQDSD